MDATKESKLATKSASRNGKLKHILLYILIGGLVVSALISVTAILVGQFNDAVAKALLTTLIFVLHSLFILGIVAADKNNTIGKSLLPTTILVVAIANVITSILGLWQIWQSQYSGRAFFLYVLLIGSAFMITAVAKLRLAHKPTAALVNVTLALILLLTVVLLPWIVASDSSIVTPFYYRLVGAVAILTATSLSIAAILNRIAVGHTPSVKIARQKTLTNGMLAINISIGTIIAFIWLFGLVYFIVTAARSNDTSSPVNTYYYGSHYNR